jgi:hypothetical protein
MVRRSVCGAVLSVVLVNPENFSLVQKTKWESHSVIC